MRGLAIGALTLSALVSAGSAARGLAAGSLAAGPLHVPTARAAGPDSLHRVGGRLAPMRRAGPAPAPRAIAVYVGAALVASGQSLEQSLRRVQPLVPFALLTARTVPPGFVPTQLAVTPRQRGISDGSSTLVYVAPLRPHAVTGTRGFVLQQTRARFVFEGASRATPLRVLGRPGTLYYFHGGRRDLLIVTGTTATGSGFALSSETTVSHLSVATLRQVADSLHA